MTKLKNNPTLLSLLKAGCTIELPSGYKLKGDPSTNYIDLSTPSGPDGLLSLTTEGVKQALTEAQKYEKELDKV